MFQEKKRKKEKQSDELPLRSRQGRERGVCRQVGRGGALGRHYNPQSHSSLLLTSRGCIQFSTLCEFCLCVFKPYFARGLVSALFCPSNLSKAIAMPTLLAYNFPSILNSAHPEGRGYFPSAIQKKKKKKELDKVYFFFFFNKRVSFHHTPP